MILTTIPLPLDPLPTMTPCAGLWDLFDSRSEEAHWRARKICLECPVVADCRPPTEITVPPFPGTQGRPSYGSTAKADGTWGGRLYRDGHVVETGDDLSDLIACTTCGATANRACTTRTGATRPPHKARKIPRICPRCGEAPAVARSNYCDPCRALNHRDAKTAYDRRRHAKEAA